MSFTFLLSLNSAGSLLPNELNEAILVFDAPKISTSFMISLRETNLLAPLARAFSPRN